ncbi:MAG: glycosyltransferase family 1 protein [Patescibacteria group bacterium]|nr:glycosyltransferase family 1 protein [Patescibacteria group bacterium]
MAKKKEKMRIGIDCRTMLSPSRGEKAGIGHYNYYLVKNLMKIDKKNEYVLFFDWRVQDTREFKQKNVKIKYFPFSQYKKFLPFTYSHILIAAQLYKEGLDILHNPANVIPLSYRRPTIVTVHDLAIYKESKWFPSGQKFSTRFLVPKSIKKADHIIAVSKATKKDIKKLFKIKNSKISVIHENAMTKKVSTSSRKKSALKRFKIKNDYILFVGTLEPRKNLLRLIEAYNDLIKNNKKFAQYDLVMAGMRGWKSKNIFRLINKLKLKNKVKFLEYIPHNYKIDLMKKATCFVFPSFYEGFGLPVLEAMTLGCPVITSKNSSLPEVCGEAAEYIDPSRSENITRALKKVLGSKKLRNSMKKKGLKQAKKFSWRKMAEETLAVYEKVYNKTDKEKKKKKSSKNKSSKKSKKKDKKKSSKKRKKKK